jgi:threonylcarbamoyl-AMP synthase-like protein
MAPPVRPDDDAARAAAIALLRDGAIVALPTDTVYGIAADLRLPDAIGRLFAAKQRPPDKAVALLIADADQASVLGEVSPAARVLAERFWPGGLTLVLPVRAGVTLPDAPERSPRRWARSRRPPPTAPVPPTRAMRRRSPMTSAMRSRSSSTAGRSTGGLPRPSSTAPPTGRRRSASARSSRRAWRPPSTRRACRTTSSWHDRGARRRGPSGDPCRRPCRTVGA